MVAYTEALMKRHKNLNFIKIPNNFPSNLPMRAVYQLNKAYQNAEKISWACNMSSQFVADL